MLKQNTNWFYSFNIFVLFSCLCVLTSSKTFRKGCTFFLQYLSFEGDIYALAYILSYLRFQWWMVILNVAKISKLRLSARNAWLRLCDVTDTPIIVMSGTRCWLWALKHHPAAAQAFCLRAAVIQKGWVMLRKTVVRDCSTTRITAIMCSELATDNRYQVSSKSSKRCIEMAMK